MVRQLEQRKALNPYDIRKPGSLPDPGFLELLWKVHPKIRTVWSFERRMWAICQVGRSGRLEPLFMQVRTPGMPLLARLNRMRMTSMRQADELEDALDQADDQVAQEAEERASQKYQEGADRVYSLLGTEVRVSGYNPQSPQGAAQTPQGLASDDK